MQQYTLPDFDTLKTMASEDPAALEKLRQNLVQQVIDAAPPRSKQRLEGLQFQIDCQRKLAKTPLAACIKISEMMHESLDTLRTLLNEVSNKTEQSGSGISVSLISADLPGSPQADVLPFKRTSV